MLTSVIGKKIGMTQIFDEKHNVVPVTVIDINHCYVTQLKTKENDGYLSVQAGLLRKRHQSTPFVETWLSEKKDRFSTLKELTIDASAGLELQRGQKVTLEECALEIGGTVSVTGMSKGKGFQGVVKRWGFKGGPGSHGSMFHRRPGASSGLRTQGEVIKGKRFPGQTGHRQVTVKGLELVKLDKEGGYLFVKGAVPGKKDSLVLVCRQG